MLLEGLEERGEFYQIGILEDVFEGTDNQQWVLKDEADERGWKYDIDDSMEWREYVEDENGDIQVVEFEKPKMRQDGLVLANLGRERVRADISIDYREPEEQRIKCRQVYKVIDEKVLEMLDGAGLRRGIEYYDDRETIEDYEEEDIGNKN